MQTKKSATRKKAKMMVSYRTTKANTVIKYNVIVRAQECSLREYIHTVVSGR